MAAFAMTKCSSLLSLSSGFHIYGLFVFLTLGGDEEDRTPDPLRARQVLSQLSYTPISFLSGLGSVLCLPCQDTSRYLQN